MMHQNLINFILLAQSDAVSAVPPAPMPWYQQWYGILAIIVAVVAIPIFLGSRIAEKLRMRDYGWKIAVILFTLIAGLLVVSTGKFQKGYDLAGGISLIYEIDPSYQPSKEDSQDLMNKMIDAISPRIDPAGVMQVTLRKYGERQVEIIIPNVNEEEAAQIKRRISTAGNLGFRILADSELDREIVAQAEASDQSFVADQTVPAQKTVETMQAHLPWIDAAEGADKDVVIDDRVGARWMDVPQDKIAEVKREEKSKGYETRVKDGRYQQLYIIGQVLARWVKVGEKQEAGGKTTPRVARDKYSVVRDRKDGGIDMLVLVDQYDVGGGYLSSARPGFRDGRIAVDFAFNTQGAKLFGALTQQTVEKDRQSNRKHRLGILLDDELLSAPTLNTVIREAGQITGDFSEEEVNWLVGVLNAGRLPAALNKTPISEQKISPTLGAATIEAGEWAIGISLLAVIVFMPFYYRFSGFVACFALLMNLVLVLAVMVAVRAAFTLPGLAGLVLTVGMAVDANVLIFERIREEMDRGAALRMAIRNGFGRATRTIVDANLTTLITGVVLYVVGTDQIKGFAVTLILGIVMSMFTAIFCSRVIFDIWEKKRWITKLSMTRILDKPNFDFLGKQRLAIGCSLLLAIVGIVGMFARGKDLLDIDLSGGVVIEVVFKEANKTEAEIAKTLEAYSNALPEGKKKLTPLSVTGITGGTNFTVETRLDELEPVKKAIQHVFGDALSTNSLSYDPNTIKTIGAAAAGEGSPSGEKLPKDSAAGTNGDTTAKPDETGAKPADSPSADSGDAPNGGATVDESKPSEPGEKSAPNDESKPSDPPSDADGARLDLPPLSLVALAEDAEIDDNTATDADTRVGSETSDDPPSAGADDGPAAETKNDEPAAADGAATEDTKDAGTPATPTPPSTGATPSDKGADKKPAEIDPALQRFAGGSEVQLRFSDKINRPTLKEMLVEILNSKDLTADVELTNREIDLGSLARAKQWTLRSTLSAAQTDSVLKLLKDQLESEPHFPTATTIGGQVALNTQFQGLAAMIASLGFIIAYIWVRFQRISYGLAAVVALIHDVLITLGLIALSTYVADIPAISQALQLESFKISLPVLAALLTLIGYSLNDTIVVFDRIREVKGKSPYLTTEMVNTSVNQTLSRTLLTAFTTWIVVVILYFIGGAGIHGFAYSLVIGIVVGTYSSIFIASPALLWMRKISSAPPATAASAGAKVPVAG